MSNKVENKCDCCGRFIAYDDFYDNKAVRYLETPDSEFTSETYVTAHIPFGECAGRSVKERE